MFTAVLGLAAVAGLASAAPLAERSQPATYYTPYLEPYDAYHLRYLALDCQDKHDTAFFESCCHPLVVADGETLADRPAYCTPNATEIASASSYIASTSEYGAPTTTAQAGNGSPATTSSSDDGGASEYCEDEPSTSTLPTSTSSFSSSSSSSSSSTPDVAPSPTSTLSVDSVAQTTSAVAATQTLTTQAALAPTTSSTPAPQTTSSQSNNNNGGSGVPSGANYGGYATFFYQNGNPGACGNYNPDSKPLVAIDKAWWPNFSQASQYCGQYVTIQNTQNGKTVVAEVQDVCPTCANGNSLDLSTGAFNQIAEEWQGQVPIVWWFNN